MNRGTLSSSPAAKYFQCFPSFRDSSFPDLNRVNFPMIIRPYRATDEADLLALWQACELLKPQNDPRKDIARKLHVNPE